MFEFLVVVTLIALVISLVNVRNRTISAEARARSAEYKLIEIERTITEIQRLLRNVLKAIRYNHRTANAEWVAEIESRLDKDGSCSETVSAPASRRKSCRTGLPVGWAGKGASPL